MIFRPVGTSDLARVTPLLTGDPASALTADQFRRRLQNGEYRAEWTWIAEEAGEEDTSNPPVAVAIWGGSPQDSLPSALDGLVAAAHEGSADRIMLAQDCSRPRTRHTPGRARTGRRTTTSSCPPTGRTGRTRLPKSAGGGRQPGKPD